MIVSSLYQPEASVIPRTSERDCPVLQGSISAHSLHRSVRHLTTGNKYSFIRTDRDTPYQPFFILAMLEPFLLVKNMPNTHGSLIFYESSGMLFLPHSGVQSHMSFNDFFVFIYLTTMFKWLMESSIREKNREQRQAWEKKGMSLWSNSVGNQSAGWQQNTQQGVH